MDVLLGIIGLQKQHLSDERVADLVVDLLTQKDDPVFQQPAVNVVRAFFAAVAFDHVRNDGHDDVLVVLVR